MALTALCASAFARAIAQRAPMARVPVLECDSLVRGARTGAVGRNAAFFLRQLQQCGQAGTEALQVVMRGVSRSQSVDTVRTFLSPAIHQRSPESFETLTQILSDESASAPARIYSARLLVMYLAPNLDFESEKIRGDGPESCRVHRVRRGQSADRGYRPDDAQRKRLWSLGADIANRRGTSARVRAVGRCLAFSERILHAGEK
jgi:hypothetical protein